MRHLVPWLILVSLPPAAVAPVDLSRAAVVIRPGLTAQELQAVTMLVRLLGKEAEAKAGTWTVPFSDLADWARPYVGYAYANGLTNGLSAERFGSDDKVTANQHLTFILRALGYSSERDFQWDKAVGGKSTAFVLPPSKPHKFCWFSGEPSEYQAKLKGSRRRS